MCRETFDLETYMTIKGVGSYVVDLVGVDFVGDVHKGTRGWTDEHSKVYRHDPRCRDVGENVTGAVDVRNVDQNKIPFMDRLA
jgi:hypothetical protein